MASPSTSAPDHRANTGNFQKSHFQQTVRLADWWLVNAENDVQGRRLGVAGLTDRGKQAMREFTSAPILKRYDAFTIETTDGICVILKGFINKARTLEHGFPSDVFNHFVFGFPLYWKEYAEKFVGKEPPSKDIATDKLLEQLSQKPGSMGGAQPHLDSHEKDFGSQGKIEAKGWQKSKRAKSLAVPLPQKYSVSGVKKESYSGDTCVEEGHTDPELSVNPDYSQLSDSGGTRFACHLLNKKSKQGAHNSRKMDDEQTKTNSDWNMSSSVSHTELRAMTRSIRKFRMKEMNNQRSVGIADCEKIRLTSISSIGSGKAELELVVDQEPVSRNNRNSEDKGIRVIKTRCKTHKAKNKAIGLPSTPATSTKSHHTLAAEDNPRDTAITRKSSLSEKAKALDMVTRQKSVPVSKETPEREKEKGWSASPKSCSINRSRSGRLLMPTLEFWRNQRAIYDADRTITGIEEA
ncbi:kinetochore-associated protein KNL-2 homolog isoform X2 [Salvia miltiorrhiza]|uniref:kinetochore-associated protein KNL-2 homolog isoform X2 n=1 Tax=Salvia miltiorrhiza TaxID=226208 RepID=UPI0025AD2A23|nr:kinetochore-associated protein KNL-2 homolog isoform X2 [Salvia miltiorrhiza]